MKQLTIANPLFTPGVSGAGILDFSNTPNFDQRKLYAVINVTKNVPLYVAGAPGLGATMLPGSQTAILLTLNTTGHSTGDELNVYYENAAGYESNTVAENGGQLQQMQESINQILQELKVQNIILAQGLNINVDDIQALRNDVANPGNQPSIY
jgi:TolA-binding protein